MDKDLLPSKTAYLIFSIFYEQKTQKTPICDLDLFHRYET